MGFIDIQGAITIIIEFIPNLFDHSVDNMVNILIVLLPLGLLLGL
jgi:hypothetical protein